VIKDFIVLQVEGISIVGQIFLPDKTAVYPLVCLCHGAPSGSPTEPGDGGYPALAERLCGEGMDVFFFNFRGTGDSGGNLDFLGWTRDLAAVIDYLWENVKFDRSRFYLVGFSAGAAVSIYSAAKDKRISGVVAGACPANFGLFTGSGDPEEIIMRYRKIGAIRDGEFPPSISGWFNDLEKVTPKDHVAKIAPRPIFFLHGSADETVPLAHARELYTLAGEPRKLVVVEGAGHRLRRDERVIRAITDWVKSRA
jgi:dipeptidyl aminopeptidase/acylaminoacyl peptidase